MRMRRIMFPIIAALSMLLVTDIAPAAAPAGVTLNGVRIGAKDVVALARLKAGTA